MSDLVQLQHHSTCIRCQASDEHSHETHEVIFTLLIAYCFRTCWNSTVMHPMVVSAVKDDAEGHVLHSQAAILRHVGISTVMHLIFVSAVQDNA